MGDTKRYEKVLKPHISKREKNRRMRQLTEDIKSDLERIKHKINEAYINILKKTMEGA